MLDSRWSASLSDGVGEMVSDPILSFLLLMVMLMLLLIGCCSIACLAVASSSSSIVSPVLPSPSLSLCLDWRWSSSSTNSAGLFSMLFLRRFRFRWTLWLRWDSSQAVKVVLKAWYRKAPGAVWKIGILVSGSWFTLSNFSDVKTAVCNPPHQPLFYSKFEWQVVLGCFGPMLGR